MRRLTKRAWFGPPRYGWGWRPRSWQGVAVSAVLLVALAADVHFVGRGPLRYVGVGAILLAWLVVMLVTGDSPGGPGL